MRRPRGRGGRHRHPAPGGRRRLRGRGARPHPGERRGLAGAADRAGRHLRQGGALRRTRRDHGERGRQRVVRRRRRRFRGYPRPLGADVEAAAFRRVRLARRRPLPRGDALQPPPRRRRPPGRLHPVDPGHLPPRARTGVRERGQAGCRVRPRTAGPACGAGPRRIDALRAGHHRRLAERPACLAPRGRGRHPRRRRLDRARPVPPLHHLRQMESHPVGRGGRHGGRRDPHVF